MVTSSTPTPMPEMKRHRLRPKTCVLERHDDARGGVPKQRVSEDGAAAEAVGDETDQRGSDEESREHGGHKTRDAGGRKPAGG